MAIKEPTTKRLKWVIGLVRRFFIKKGESFLSPIISDSNQNIRNDR